MDKLLILLIHVYFQRNKHNPIRGALPLGCKVFVDRKKWPYAMLTFWKIWNRSCNLPWAPSKCQCPSHQAIWHGCSLIPTKNRPQQQKVNYNLHEFLCEITINTIPPLVYGMNFFLETIVLGNTNEYLVMTIGNS